MDGCVYLEYCMGYPFSSRYIVEGLRLTHRVGTLKYSCGAKAEESTVMCCLPQIAIYGRRGCESEAAGKP